MRTLALIAALTPVLSLHAVDLSDGDQLTLNFGMDVQTRAETAVAHDASGRDWDINRGEIGRSDEVQYSVRRARLLMDGSYGPNWKFYLGFLADNVDRNYYNQGNTATAPTSGGGREVALFKAYMRRLIPLGDGYSMYVQGGMDFPYFNRGIIGDPWWMFAQQRPSVDLMGVRGVGGRVLFSGKTFDFAIDVQEGLDPARDPSNAGQEEGMFYSSRLEVYAFNDSDKKPAYRESYRGAPGRSLMFAVDGAIDNRDWAVKSTRTDSMGGGTEALLHLDRLTGVAEARFLNVHQDSTTPAGFNGIDNAQVFLAQAGYAIPVDGIFVEPALRFSWIDNNVGNRDTIGAYNTGAVKSTMSIPTSVLTNGGTDGVNSGHQIDVGMNFYFNRLMSTLVSYSYWKAKTGVADANIVRSQFQFVF